MFKVLLCVGTEHDWLLVALAALVCLPASFATFFVYAKTPAAPAWRRLVWLAMTGLVAGSGIWTTHFIGMLAFRTGLPTGYAVEPTIASLVVAVLATTLGFAVASARAQGREAALTSMFGGLIVGGGITGMHYLGMNGYRVAGVLSWDASYVAASAVVGAIFAAAALFVARPGARTSGQLLGGGLLALGIVGMHFTGMTALFIRPDGRIPVPTDVMSDGAMALAATGCTALILLTALSAAVFESVTRKGAARRLRETLNALPNGVAFFDAEDRLVAWNERYEELSGAAERDLSEGMLFRDMLKAKIARGVYPDAIGREDEWIDSRLEGQRVGGPPLVERASNGRWLNIMHRRTADGGAVAVLIDVTALKATELALEQARDEAEEQARRAEVAETIAGLGHWRVDAKTHEVTWSKQLYRMYGMDPGQPLDLAAVMAMSHPDEVQETNERVARQFVTGEGTENVLSRIIAANGEVRYLSSSSAVERGPDGDVLALFGTVVDVTEQKKAEAALAESEERFRRLAENAPDIIAESRLDGVLTYVSPACLAITGFTPEELVGKRFAEVMVSEDAHKIEAMCQTVFASKGEIAPWAVEFRALSKSGEPLWLECKPRLATDPASGRFTGLNDVIRDITPRKVMESELRHAQAEAEAAAAVKGEFLANMSHELRTPLTSIIGFTKLAGEQPELGELTRDYVGRVGEASRALLCTVNDILDFSKLEAGQVAIHPQPVVLSKLSRATLDLFAPQAGSKDLALTLDDRAGEDVVLNLDPDRIRQILLNFVSNAVKFTAAGGVTLRTSYEDGTLAVDVIDTGAGIPPDKQELLFKRFSQVDGSLTRSAGGTGLGLAICKGLIEAMGGDVGVESKEGEGSRFWFKIPAATGSLADVETEGPTHERPAFEGARVLVVDDHPANRELARLFLAGVGAEVTEASDGEEAVALASEWPFDVILMDMRMPKLDGPGAVRRIREEIGPNDATPILAFTADADPATIEALAAQGFQGFVAKPVEPQALIAAVARATAFADEPAQEVAYAG